MIISFGQLQLTNNKVGGKSPKRAFMLLFCRRPAVELNFSDWASKTQSWIDVLPQFLKLAVNIKYIKHQVFFRNEGNIPEALKKIQAVAGIDEMPKSQIEKRKRNMESTSRVSRREKRNVEICFLIQEENENFCQKNGEILNIFSSFEMRREIQKYFL